MQVNFSKRFSKQFIRLKAGEKDRFYSQLSIWLGNPAAPILHVHALKGRYLGFYSMNVGGDLRALYKVEGNETVLFDFIGSHSQLYG